MEVQAKLKNASLSAQKARLVANVIRKLPVNEAMEILSFTSKEAARLMRKLLGSALANAEHNFSADIDKLIVSTVYVDEGRTQKRTRARAKGRANQILKRSCHITLKVSENEE